jgi:crotonobetainyl-CoA:carnitine CoA-transferase CaiB-like acyl-CoA transferase
MPERLTVLSLEQATTLPYLTYRLAQEGARVIRVENPPRGDPNRWVGPDVLGEPGMNAYFLPNNAGKQAITLNLASERGRAILHELIVRLDVDVFATNQRPKDYARLGIDYETLRAIRPDLIWLGITGFGPDSNEAAYDPVLQARAGWMDLNRAPPSPPSPLTTDDQRTTEGRGGPSSVPRPPSAYGSEGLPLAFGLPLVDLGAAEHAYGQVMRALYLRATTGQGTRIDLSMFRSAVSWLVSPIMLQASFGIPTVHRGNRHPFFAPVDVFPTVGGHIYLAVGNDRQWEALTRLPGFEALAEARYRTNAGRAEDAEALCQRLAAITCRMPRDDLVRALRKAGVPVAQVSPIAAVLDDPALHGERVRARDPRTGVEIVLPPPPVTPPHLVASGWQMSFPPRLGEHNAAIYGDLLGYDAAELERLRQEGII